jgi:hypothetical protein
MLFNSSSCLSIAIDEKQCVVSRKYCVCCVSDKYVNKRKCIIRRISSVEFEKIHLLIFVVVESQYDNERVLTNIQYHKSK